MSSRSFYFPVVFCLGILLHEIFSPLHINLATDIAITLVLFMQPLLEETVSPWPCRRFLFPGPYLIITGKYLPCAFHDPLSPIQ